MLIRYKKSLEKIAMGLLSFMPELKDDLKKLMDTIREYDQSDNRQLYLWKLEDEYIGAIGIEMEGDTATIHHITVMPSYRGEGVGRAMINALCELDSVSHVRSIDESSPFIQKCLCAKSE